jgi:polyhydroxybutyrate depolymerase
VLSAEASVAAWAQANGCTGEPESTLLVDGDPNQAGRVRQIAYRDCAAPVVLDTVEGGGHTWPGGGQYLGEKMIGKTSRSFDANRAIVQFFYGLMER